MQRQAGFNQSQQPPQPHPPPNSQVRLPLPQSSHLPTRFAPLPETDISREMPRVFQGVSGE